MMRSYVKKLTLFLAFTCFVSGVLPGQLLYAKSHKKASLLQSKQRQKESWQSCINKRISATKSFIKKHKKKLATSLVAGVVTYLYLRGYFSHQPLPYHRPTLPVFGNNDVAIQQNQQTVCGATQMNCDRLHLPQGRHNRHWDQRVVQPDTGHYAYVHRPTGQRVWGVRNGQQIAYYVDEDGNRVFDADQHPRMQRVFVPLDVQFTLPDNIRMHQVPTAQQQGNSCAYSALKNTLLKLNEFALNQGDLDQHLHDEQLMNNMVGTGEHPGIWRNHILQQAPATADHQGEWVNRQGVNQLIQFEQEYHAVLNPQVDANIVVIEDSDLQNNLFNEPATQAIRAQLNQNNGHHNYGFVLRNRTHWTSAVLHKNPDNSLNWVFSSSNRNQQILEWLACQLLVAAICGNQAV